MLRSPRYVIFAILEIGGYLIVLQGGTSIVDAVRAQKRLPFPIWRSGGVKKRRISWSKCIEGEGKPLQCWFACIS